MTQIAFSGLLLCIACDILKHRLTGIIDIDEVFISIKLSTLYGILISLMLASAKQDIGIMIFAVIVMCPVLFLQYYIMTKGIKRFRFQILSLFVCFLIVIMFSTTGLMTLYSELYPEIINKTK